MDEPKCWVKNAIKNVQLKVKVESFDIFNPTFGFVHIFGLKQPSVV